MEQYYGKKAVVIGGTSGMGYATVEKLAKGGAQVILTGRNQSKLTEAEQLHSGVRGVVSDITDMSAIDELAELVSEQFGTFDYLFLNNGICEIENIDQITESSYDRQFNVNTKGAFFTMQKLSPLMNSGGAITITSSVADHVGIIGMGVYTATKSALMGFMRVFAVELLPRNIRVNSISVGYANTPSMGLQDISEADKQAFAEDGSVFTPMGRIASVEEFALFATFMAHDATFMTGVNVPFDGGMELGIFANMGR